MPESKKSKRTKIRKNTDKMGEKVRKNTTKSKAQRNRELALLKQQKAALHNGLPHKYGWPWYDWAKKFYESTNYMNLLTAANQISKSSTQIRKAIHWATATELWGDLWKTTPRQFWYLYPNKDTCTSEFKQKWVPEFMPRNEFKDHPQYGWKEKYEAGKISYIEFNSGVTIYFKTYGQNVADLQAGTVHAIFCDEELPMDYYDELMLRLQAVDGYFHMVFTATLNQDFWRRAIEGKDDAEVLKDAFKQQISMYDCAQYADGTPAPWTNEKIDRVKAACKSEIEVQRRVYGRFVTESGRKYAAFNPDRHFTKQLPITPEWKFYGGVDIGSGGGTGHPSAIVIVAVSPDHKSGVVLKGWRGDGYHTTAGDVLEKYQEMTHKLRMTLQCYDPKAIDFGLIAARIGVPFNKAQNSHEQGENVVNTLFRNDMLHIFDGAELRKLGVELTGLMKNTPKGKAVDDFCDALRYCCMQIPWDWTDLALEGEKKIKERTRPLTDKEMVAYQIDRRRGIPDPLRQAHKDDDWGDFYSEIEEWNNFGE